MRRILFLAAMLCSGLTMMAVPNETYKAYIDQWKAEALQQQAQYGVPAAITLAQGLLESAAGQSDLAKRANNHFGIKSTSDWQGGSVMHKGSAYRKYDNAAESYRDHSLFLRRPRYAKLFDLAPTDFAGWANGLKMYGYAEDPQYPEKLLRIIDDYELANIAPAEAPATQPAESTTSATVQQTKTTVQKPVLVTKSEPIAIITKDPEPEPEYLSTLGAKEELKIFLDMHPKYKMNGCRYVVALEGDTYSNVAFRLNVTERSLRENNDALGRTLKPGDRIYLGKKRAQGPRDHAQLWVHPGESLWEICQREAVQMSKVMEYNGWSSEIREFQTRQTILLTKPKEEKK